MTEPTNPQQPSKEERQVQNIWNSIKKFLRELLDIRNDTDHEATLATIRADIPMKGHTAWILVCAIFIASIGLNVNSTAVVIGAMLISPLMGPIMGLGMGVAINDGLMLRRSLTNLGVMIGISVITSFIYFSLSPIKELTPELAGRTFPTFLDVLIAISGGLALIIARSKTGTIMSVLVGVAIATALMPPLCTAGYGLAMLGEESFEPWQGLWFFAGAMYLFSINTVYIALSAYVIARVLKFPMAKYANPEQRKRISRNATIVGLLALAPSVWTFATLYQELSFESTVKTFVTNEIEYPGADVLKSEWDYEKKEIDIYFFGEEVPENILLVWEDKLKKTAGLEDVKLNIRQDVDNDIQTSEIQQDYISKVKKLNTAEAEIAALKLEIEKLKTQGIPAGQIFQEARPIFPSLKKLAISKSIVSDFTRIDTMNIFEAHYDQAIKKKDLDDEATRLSKWLEIRLGLDTAIVNIRQMPKE